MVRLQGVREDELEQVADFLAGDEWPFHGNPRPDRDSARRWVLDERRFSGPDARCWWIHDGSERVGLVALHELGDPTPIFDLRLSSSKRGRGLGRRALARLADWLFENTDRTRLEAHVRADNAVMRRCLAGAGPWVQEAHHRLAWPDAAGVRQDCVTCSLLRQDWESGEPTPVPPLEPPRSSPRSG